jgi:hypothetical protein
MHYRKIRHLFAVILAQASQYEIVKLSEVKLQIPCILKRLYNNVEEMADRKSLGQKKAVESRIAIFDKKQKARTVVRTRQRVRISKEGRDGERWIKGKGT